MWTITTPQTPISRVGVYVVGHDWEPLTYTDNTGSFSLQNLCTDTLELRFDKQGLIPQQEKYTYDDLQAAEGNVYLGRVGKMSH